MKEKALVLISTKSGNADPVRTRAKIEKYLSDLFELKFVQIADNFEETMAFSLSVLNEYGTFIICGGDGTLRNAVGYLANHSDTLPKFGFIPTGTLCDAGKNLGIKNNIDKAIETIKAGNVHPFDLIQVNNEIAIYMAAVGAYSDIAYATSRKNVRRYGKFAYYWRSFFEAFAKRRVNITFEIDGKQYQARTGFLLILNGKKVGGFPVNPKGKADDGKLEVFYTNGGIFNGLANYFFHIGVHRISTPYIRIQSIDDNIWCVDGEPLELSVTEIKIHSKPAYFYSPMGQK